MISRYLTVSALLAALAACPAYAADLTGTVPAPIGTIEVDGHGEARARPDTVELSLAIETHAATAEQSARLNAVLAGKVSEALKSKLGDKGRIETGSYSLMPEYNEPLRRGKPQVIGYRAGNSITVETGATDLAGPLIDAAVKAGANRVNYLNFTLRDDTKARTQAIAQASKDAQAQADALAASLGVKLKRVYHATTVSEERPIAAMAAGSMFAVPAGNAPTPVEPTEITVPAHVSLIYEIE
ncbi:MAG: SIMPL domain-containing protein [Candidatus Binataceae bacterium]